MKNEVLGVIPARGDSKGIPRKNLVDLNGAPLVSYIIRSALKAKRLDKLVVTTEDEEIAQVAKKYGAEVPFLRPKELADDDVSLIPVIKHAADYLEKNESWNADIVVSLQSTCPLTSPEDIDSAVRKLIDTGCDSVISVCEAENHPFWTYRLDKDRLIPFQCSDQAYLQRQDLPKAYVISGAIYSRKRKLLNNWSGKDFALGKNIRVIVLDPISKDIHNLNDLWLVEKFLKENNQRKS